jgi:hypothetical protein
MTAAASWYHCSVKTVSRSAGRSVVAAAAYRLGERLHEAETDQTHDYTRRGGVTETFALAPSNAPDWATDPERLWNAANAAEKRKNSTLAREIELALPAAVDAPGRAGIARAMAQALVDRYRVAVSVGIHAPSQAGNQGNHHCHILFTTRRMEPDGLGAKTRVLDDRKTGPQEVTFLRSFACDLINDALADAGSDERVDHRSFAARGIEQEPTEHLGPAASAKQRRREAAERGELNDDIIAGNQRLDGLVQELADLDTQIAAEQERALDARFGEADSEPALALIDGQGVTSPADAFAAVHRETMAQVPFPDPGLAMFLPEPGAEVGRTFAVVHDRTIFQARADAAVVDAEEARAPGTRFARFRAWLDTMREHIVEWRDQIQERLDHYRGRDHEQTGIRQEPELDP